MHRHGYQGRKFGRQRDQRRALIKSLADSLIINESIETTLPKAKELVPYMEKLVTKAKKSNLSSRRQIISAVHTTGAAHKLMDELAPKLKTRDSGHFTLKRTVLRRGDNAQLARVSFIFDTKTEKAVEAKTASDKTATKPTDKTEKPVEAEKAETAKPVAKNQGESKISAKTSFKNIAKRSGRRGNR